MAFDFKKEYKEFYLPKATPTIVDVPMMRYIAMRGAGDPNAQDGDYQRALMILYTLAYTLKMSYKGEHRIEGFFEYVVPPLEGFWWQEGVDGMDYSRKAAFQWLSVIRVPDFVTQADFDWAVEVAARKKNVDASPASLCQMHEGLCVQILHVGPYDDEPASVALMDEYIAAQGYENDFSDVRRHHEIYLSDARKVEPAKWRTVIRHPVRQISL